jgi:predicted nucleic acid-binding protein
MSDESTRQFVDTNVLVYAHDATAGDKHIRAKQLMADLWANSNGCLSIQVLQEFYVTVTRKVKQPLDPDVARQHVEDLGQWLVHSPTVGDICEAIQLHQRARLSFWDALVLTSAQKLNCAALWSEDFSEGQTFAGIVVRSPFKVRG